MAWLRLAPWPRPPLHCIAAKSSFPCDGSRHTVFLILLMVNSIFEAAAKGGSRGAGGAVAQVASGHPPGMIGPSRAGGGVANRTSFFPVYQAAPGVGPDGAFVDCPCLTSLRLPLATVPPSMTLPPLPTATQKSLVPAAFKGYGSCHAWGGHPEHGSCTGSDQLGPKKECDAKWCYVDPANCKHKYMNHSGLSYSFSTCGNIDRRISLLKAPLRAETPVRVFANGEVLKASKGQRRNDMYFNQRAMLDFAGVVLERLGLNLSEPEQIVYQELSAHALEASPNAYTACVYDIALGCIDLCVGVCFDTPVRRNMRVPFSSTVYSETFHLVAPSGSKEDLGHMLWKPFSPFAPELWLCIIVVIAFAAIAQSVFEDTACSHLVYREGEPVSAQKVIYESVASFLALSLTYSPETMSGRLFAIGYGFFILVCGASYTANLAGMLIAEKATIDTLDGALRSKWNICYYTGTQQSLLDRYPGLEQAGVAFEVMEDVPTALSNGTCKGAIMAPNWLQTEQAQGGLCGFKLSAEVVLSVPVGYWTSKRVEKAISWQVANETVHGVWDHVREAASRPSLCAPEEMDTTSLSVRHCLGVIIIVAAFFLVALVVRITEVVLLYKKHGSWRNLERAEAVAEEDNLAQPLSRQEAANDMLDHRDKGRPAQRSFAAL